MYVNLRTIFFYSLILIGYDILQEKGNRNYHLANGDVILQSATVNTLKCWNTKYSTVLYDSKFLKKIAVDVFGLECLGRSSVFGMQAWNSSLRHDALDLTKLNFVRGNFEIIHWNYIVLLEITIN